MTPLYVLLALAAWLVLALFWSFRRGRGARLRGEPFERRPWLSVEERRCYQQIQDAAGAGYRLFPRVAAAALLEPLSRIGREQRRLAWARLREGWADVLICSATDLYPLCVIQFAHPGQGRGREARQARQTAARMRSIFAAAGMPVIELSLADLPTPERLATLIHEALAMTDADRIARPQPRLGRVDVDDDDDEAALLSELAAAMRDAESRSER